MRYEELLQRNDKGLYKYQLNIQPKEQKIRDFVIKVKIDESLPLNNVAIWKEKDQFGGKKQRNEITSQALTHERKSLPNQAYIEFYPNEENNNGNIWKFQVLYDVERLVSIQLQMILDKNSILH